LVLRKFKILENCAYNKLLNGFTATLEGIKETYNLPGNLNQDGLFELIAHNCKNAVLQDDFYKERLSVKERKKLAKITNQALTSHKTKIVKILRKNCKKLFVYMWRHPLFLFKKDFYSRLKEAMR